MEGKMVESFERKFTLYMLMALVLHSFRDWDFVLGLGNLLPIIMAAIFSGYMVWREQRERIS
jgi:hypothetical protein